MLDLELCQECYWSCLVRREEYGTEGALDTLGPGGVVPGGDELSPAAPGTVVQDLEGEVVREARRRVVSQETLAESLRLPPGDHPAPPGGDGHGPRPPEDLQLDRSALDTGDPQRHPSVVDLVVGIILEESVGDLGQTQSLLGVHHQTDDPDAVDDDCSDLGEERCEL